ncbi:MAG TPA: hypothetical protein ENI86_18345 [Acidimicrobiales bacterium]|nr:hypothetical protein [Acidimicrobiales bacterium]
MAHPDLDRCLGPEFVADLESVSLEVLRQRRSLLLDVEGQISYCRRVAQSRLDLVSAELSERRRRGRGTDLAEMVRRLPEILAMGEPGGLGGEIPPVDPDPAYLAEVDAAVPPARIVAMGDLNREELTDMAVKLQNVEVKVSVQRSLLHERIDRLNREIGCRYEKVAAG